MLVLNRKTGERVVIGDAIEVVVLEVHNNRVKLGFCGPPEVPIHREELYRRIRRPDHRPVPTSPVSSLAGRVQAAEMLA